MAATTSDFLIRPEDGWVAVTSGATTFLAINANSAGVWWIASSASAPQATDVQASGVLTTTGTFTAAETVTIGSTVFTITATPSAPTDVLLGTTSATLAALATAINANLTTVHATSDATTLTVTSVAVGPSTIATTETCVNASFAAATLQGGLAAVIGLRQYTDCDGDDEILIFPSGIPSKVWVRVGSANLGGTQPNMAFSVIAG